MLKNVPEEYITFIIAQNTRYKSLKEAYERNLYSIIRHGNVFYIEGYGCSDRIYKLAIKETKRLFPDLKYLHDTEEKQ